MTTLGKFHVSPLINSYEIRKSAFKAMPFQSLSFAENCYGNRADRANQLVVVVITINGHSAPALTAQKRPLNGSQSGIH